MLKYPTADFRIGKPELQKHNEDSTLQVFTNNESWLFFDQPVIGIEPTFSRTDSVVYWKKEASF